MNTPGTLKKLSPIAMRMDDDKKQLIYKIIFGVVSTAAVVGIPYAFYMAAMHLL